MRARNRVREPPPGSRVGRRLVDHLRPESGVASPVKSKLSSVVSAAAAASPNYHLFARTDVSAGNTGSAATRHWAPGTILDVLDRQHGAVSNLK